MPTRSESAVYRRRRWQRFEELKREINIVGARREALFAEVVDILAAADPGELKPSDLRLIPCGGFSSPDVPRPQLRVIQGGAS